MSTSVSDLQAIESKIAGLSKDQLKKVLELPGVMDRLKKRWQPNPGPQTKALQCEADELFYGGQAGGGKTDLLLGAAFTEHKRSLILRRTNKESSRFIERFSEIVGHRDGWNGQSQTFTLSGGGKVEFGGCQLEDDKQKYKGDPKDLIGFDELSDFTESQYRFIIGWNRSADKKQRCRVIGAGNPPTRPEGLWVLKYWGAWLDPTHENPAEYGELRWYTTIGGEDVEVDGRGPHEIEGELIEARSRTFIPAALSDNPDLAETNYASVLAALPEELRAAYRDGRFDASLRDDEWQVIPTRWIDAAMERWKPRERNSDEAMTAMAMDCAGEGTDAAVIAHRYGGWYGELKSIEGSLTANGSEMAAQIMRIRRDACPVIVDVGGGYAGAVIERFKDNGIDYYKFNGANGSLAVAQGTGVKFANKRAASYWKFREALDPDQEGGSVIQLPRDQELKADLAAARYTLGPRGIILEKKEDTKKRIGRSPDKGDSVVMCHSEGERLAARRLQAFTSNGGVPRNIRGYEKHKRKI